jgi:hypothetical protein
VNPPNVCRQSYSSENERIKLSLMRWIWWKDVKDDDSGMECEKKRTQQSQKHSSSTPHLINFHTICPQPELHQSSTHYCPHFCRYPLPYLYIIACPFSLCEAKEWNCCCTTQLGARLAQKSLTMFFFLSQTIWNWRWGGTKITKQISQACKERKKK